MASQGVGCLLAEGQVARPRGGGRWLMVFRRLWQLPRDALVSLQGKRNWRVVIVS